MPLKSDKQRPKPWYNPDGDCISYVFVDNEAVVADDIDGFLTIYRSVVDNRPIGFLLSRVSEILEGEFYR